MKPVIKKNTEKNTEKNWERPGVKLTHEEFTAGIREAEKGPFYTSEEVDKILKEWRKKK